MAQPQLITSHSHHHPVTPDLKPQPGMCLTVTRVMQRGRTSEAIRITAAMTPCHLLLSHRQHRVPPSLHILPPLPPLAPRPDTDATPPVTLLPPYHFNTRRTYSTPLHKQHGYACRVRPDAGWQWQGVRRKLMLRDPGEAACRWAGATRNFQSAA